MERQTKLLQRACWPYLAVPVFPAKSAYGGGHKLSSHNGRELRCPTRQLYPVPATTSDVANAWSTELFFDVFLAPQAARLRYSDVFEGGSA